MRKVVLPLLLLIATAAIPAQSTAAPAQGDIYVVQFQPNVNASSQGTIARGLGISIQTQYTAAINGFAASMSSVQAAALAKNPNVLTVEPDAIATVDGSQSGASWGLDRVDQATLPLDGVFNYPDTTSSVKVYVFDTGVSTTFSDFNKQFGTRVAGGASFISDGNGTEDCNGHGTHVAGTIGSSDYGVAKKANIVPVRILNCKGSGTLTQFLQGVDWAIADHPYANTAVANMSLGFNTKVSSADTAITNLFNDNIVTAVAAGNSGTPACNSSPGRAPSAITVAATDSADNKASWSNYGSCVDLFAPGVGINSLWYTGGTASLSGTSMAAPHVAGIAALLVAVSTKRMSASILSNQLVSLATSGVLKSIGAGSPNRLAFLPNG